jgi:diguanylate cyclase (GGDEF)-like protein
MSNANFFRFLRSYHNDIIKQGQVHSVKRMRVVLYVIGIIQFLQLILYLALSNETYNNIYLVLVKFTAVLMSTFYILWINDKLRKSKHLEVDYNLILALIMGSTMILAILNSFIAQSITSDISIYLLVLFINSVIVLLKPSVMMGIYLFTYGLFAIGMPFFQPKTDYLISHLANGFIFNIIAFVIAHMLYKHTVAEILDKAEIHKKNKEMAFLAQHDGLTGLYNHQTIHEYLEGFLATEEIIHLSIILLDLDDFKSVNDIFGHNSGDLILKQVSEAIMKNTRLNDRVGRYGGDEFLMLLPETSLESARHIAERILQDVREIQIADFKLTCSAGIAHWNNESPTQFVERADRAMYHVKRSGKDGVHTLEV